MPTECALQPKGPVTRVLIVDDSAVVRDRVARLLQAAAGVRLVGHATNIASALRQIDEHRPDAVILDLGLEGGSGIEVLERLQASAYRPRVVVFTNYPLEEYRRRCFDLGATAFLDKSVQFDQVVSAVTRRAPLAPMEQDGDTAPACLDRILSWAPAVLYVVLIDRRRMTPVWVTPNIERLTGFTVADALAPGWHGSRLHDDDRPRLAQAMRLLYEQGSVEIRYRLRHKDGRWLWIHDELRLIRDAAGEPREAIGTLLNVTERVSAKEALADREARYQAVAEATSDAIVVTEGAVIRDVNAGFMRALGYSPAEVVGQSPLEFVAPEQRAEVAGHLAATTDTQFETVAIAKDGHRVEIEVTARVHTDASGRRLRLTALRDLSERRRLEKQFQQAQKLEAVARLAGVVAHDFNNLLTAAAGFVELALGQLAPDAAGRDDLEAARTSLGDGRALASQLLQVSRPARAEASASDVNVLVVEDEPVLRRLVTPTVTLVTELEPGVPAARVSAGQLRQILMNLAINARDAMPQGGRLTIATAVVSFNGDTPPTLTPGRYIRLRVTDTGIGMDAAVQARIFEPFFTTKEAKGTGLGLASVYGIVSAAGGTVAVTSAPGCGATFEIFLPTAREPRHAS